MRKFGYLIVAYALTTFNAVNADTPAGMETCYGIAKAGQNDCASATTTCDKSVIDGDPNYFLYVPTGLCNKIVGGMLSANSDDMDMPPLPAMPSSTTTTTTPSSTTTTPMPTAPSAPSMPSNMGNGSMAPSSMPNKSTNGGY